MDTKNKDRVLYYLEELTDYKVINSDKDVRGWKVNDSSGKTVGKVDNLLVNKNTEQVVYLDVEVDESIISANLKPYSAKAKDGIHDFINEEGESHIIIPIGMATLDLEKKIVFTEKIDFKTFAQTKRIKRGALINRDYEIDVYDSYTRPMTETNYPEDDTFYQRDGFGT